MRHLLAIVATLALAQCATGGRDRFAVGQSDKAFVIIGVAEAYSHRDPMYRMLWRRLDATGQFLEYDDDTIFEPETHARRSVRVRGVPGEFIMAEIEPGVYALDSVFAVVRDGSVNYSANGVVTGPSRPAFDVRAGEAVYLGVWELSLDDATSTGRLWRLDEADLRAALRGRRTLEGQAVTRETYMRDVPCAPHRLGTNSLREIC